jgi:hypothetical protein
MAALQLAERLTGSITAPRCTRDPGSSPAVAINKTAVSSVIRQSRDQEMPGSMRSRVLPYIA